MSRVEILAQVRRFGRQVREQGARIKVEGEAPMTDAEVEAWVARQAFVQCPKCGAYRR